LRPLLRARGVVPVPDRPRDLARAWSGTGVRRCQALFTTLNSAWPRYAIAGGAPWL